MYEPYISDFLTEDQKEVVKNLFKFVESNERFFCLTGYAGVGKTTTITDFLRGLNQKDSSIKVCATAPTHKALNVLETMFKEHGVEFATIHSLLGLRPTITSDGREIFVKDKRTKSTKIQDFDLIILDEASMLDDLLFAYILEAVEKSYSGLKVIFAGDKMQIPPINHNFSIPMIEQKRKDYEIDHNELNKVLRQAKGNPIINFATQVRKGKIEIKSDFDKNTGMGVYKFPMERSLKIFKKFFISKQYEDNPDFCRVLCWTNAMVDFCNKWIREFKYGATAPAFVEGERIIANAPIFDKMEEDNIIFKNNEELEVFEIDSDDFYDVVFGKRIRLYNLKLKSFYDGRTKNVEIVHEDSKADFQRILDKMVKTAEKLKKGTPASRDAWVQYYKLKRSYADVKYAYAVTSHKSQGSTYDNTIIMVDDILKNRKKLEMVRILYTACTRAKNKLILIQ